MVRYRHVQVQHPDASLSTCTGVKYSYLNISGLIDIQFVVVFENRAKGLESIQTAKLEIGQRALMEVAGVILYAQT
jgi:hypothetical protein